MKPQLNFTILKDVPMSEFFDPDGNSLGKTNDDLVINDFRRQVRQCGVSGYYIIFDGRETIRIDREGNLDRYPDGFLDTYTKVLLDLI